MIPQHIVEQVQSSSDIVDVISSHIPLKRAGRSFKACCPFHSEKTPSFLVSPEKQIWHCFGCGAGGSVFNFIALYERVSFPEAVRLLAEKAGIAIPETRGRDDGDGRKKEDLYRLNEFAASWFKQQLHTTDVGKRVLAYLQRRGMKPGLIERFSLGYAPDSWNGLYNAARKKGHREDALLTLGLVMRKEGGSRVFDRFRKRLMIPISDVSGRVVAFSGRVLDNGTPKYMNSPESPLFNKSRSLYGLNHAKRELIDRGFSIVVEGYFDLFALFSAGIGNAVASQGTAFTTDHARILKRYSSEVVMSFDADAAGQGAAMRSLDAFLNEDLRVRVLVLPPPHDPDTFIRDKGASAFADLVTRAPDYFDFMLDHLCRRHDHRSEVGKARIASEFLDALAQVGDGILREAYRKKLSDRIDIPQEYIIEAIRKKGRPQRPATDGVEEPRQGTLSLPAGEREIVRLMIEDENVIRQAAMELTAEDFRHEQLQRIAAKVFALLKENQWKDSNRLLACLEDEQCARLVSRLITEEEPGGDRSQVARDCIRYLKKRNLKEEIGKITKEISRREREGSAGREISGLQRRLMEKKAELLKIG
jgi:DNA primase